MGSQRGKTTVLLVYGQCFFPVMMQCLLNNTLRSNFSGPCVLYHEGKQESLVLLTRTMIQNLPVSASQRSMGRRAHPRDPPTRIEESDREILVEDRRMQTAIPAKV
jgi:hypothetical protein